MTNIDIKQDYYLVRSEVSIQTSPHGVPVLEMLEDPDHYKGPDRFTSVITFGRVFQDLGLPESLVPESERWSADNPPPSGITIGEFQNPIIEARMRAIEAIAARDFYQDPEACARYYKHNRSIFRHLGKLAGVDPSRHVFMSLVRAGIAAGQFLGFAPENQIMIQSKRLQLPNKAIAIGTSYYNPDDIWRFDGKDVVIGDPAGATYASILASIVGLDIQGIRPKSITIINTCASHKGSLFALSALNYLGYSGRNLRILSGGYSPRMNGKYYLETAEGNPSVRDAGDGLNRFLPEEFQL